MKQSLPYSSTGRTGEYLMSESRRRRRINILLVEDSPSDADLMIDALHDGSLLAKISWCQDGEEAMMRLRRQAEYHREPRPDLILLDLHLPRKNGHEVLTELKENDELRRIPVVIFTASGKEEDYQTAYDLRANCCVPKPVDPKQFIEAVRRIERFWSSVAS